MVLVRGFIGMIPNYVSQDLRLCSFGETIGQDLRMCSFEWIVIKREWNKICTLYL